MALPPARRRMSASLELLPVVASVPAGRRFVTAYLHEHGLGVLAETAALLTSELLTNCVLHARTPIRLTVTAGTGSVEVVIRDGLPVAPRQRGRRPDATTGRGIDLLDRLATSWQVTLDAEGKSIRFTLDAATDPWAAYVLPGWRDA
jgi:anti-sigma regulatory factor (Ser/Thr protein kinase)